MIPEKEAKRAGPLVFSGMRVSKVRGGDSDAGCELTVESDENEVKSSAKKLCMCSPSQKP
jgi:hypothetical protein